MGLYLCVFDGDDEIDGVEIGNYSDFDYFRSSVAELIEAGVPGSKYPVLMNHSDSDGEWSARECQLLQKELLGIRAEFQELPGVSFRSDWQQQVGGLLNLKPSSLAESFIDVDGEPILDRLIDLCDVAIKHGKPILFQ